MNQDPLELVRYFIDPKSRGYAQTLLTIAPETAPMIESLLRKMEHPSIAGDPSLAGGFLLRIMEIHGIQPAEETDLLY